MPVSYTHLKKAERLLDEINITANKNAIPFDTEKPFKASGIRVGTPAMTTKGFNEDDFREVGKIIAYRLKNEETEEVKTECIARVKALDVYKRQIYSSNSRKNHKNIGILFDSCFNMDIDNCI